MAHLVNKKDDNEYGTVLSDFEERLFNNVFKIFHWILNKTTISNSQAYCLIIIQFFQLLYFPLHPMVTLKSLIPSFMLFIAKRTTWSLQNEPVFAYILKSLVNLANICWYLSFVLFHFVLYFSFLSYCISCEYFIPFHQTQIQS